MVFTSTLAKDLSQYLFTLIFHFATLRSFLKSSLPDKQNPLYATKIQHKEDQRTRKEWEGERITEGHLNSESTDCHLLAGKGRGTPSGVLSREKTPPSKSPNAAATYKWLSGDRVQVWSLALCLSVPCPLPHTQDGREAMPSSTQSWVRP